MKDAFPFCMTFLKMAVIGAKERNTDLCRYSFDAIIMLMKG